MAGKEATGRHAPAQNNLAPPQWHSRQGFYTPMTVPIIPNGGFYPFYFDENYEWAYQNFTYFYDEKDLLSRVVVVDAFCPGDVFSMYYQTVDGTAEGWTTCRTYVPLTSCSVYALTPPDVNANLASYCNFFVELPNSANYLFRIFVKSSLYRTGAGFIAAFPLDEDGNCVNPVFNNTLFDNCEGAISPIDYNIYIKGHNCHASSSSSSCCRSC